MNTMNKIAAVHSKWTIDVVPMLMVCQVNFDSIHVDDVSLFQTRKGWQLVLMSQMSIYHAPDDVWHVHDGDVPCSFRREMSTNGDHLVYHRW